MSWRVTVADRKGTLLEYKTLGSLPAVAGMIHRYRVRQNHRVSVHPALSLEQRQAVDRLVDRFAERG